ncbi:tripartite motif-containing protein 2-like [Ostrea edulis]|uniref:tripartite motif-containing protein 2-like n=1 Tax=Ostrea edulis TaxID=37623 RepID=UPI0024AF7C2B|nr:tripartite motif-containing protein 2-like [Ostrea edulis]
MATITICKDNKGKTIGNVIIEVYSRTYLQISIFRFILLYLNSQIQTIVRLTEWRPWNVSNTVPNDILVTIVSDDRKQSKGVRYSDSTETQTIQFENMGRPLYSSYVIRYLSENRNLNICKADRETSTVVVVNQSGIRYSIHSSNTKELFETVGIATDSQSHILTADYDDHRIHILDQDGQFLRYIHNCGLYGPYGLCVDIKDNLFVANGDKKVKKIQYL